MGPASRWLNKGYLMYCIDNGIWSSVFAVPAEIVDKHLKLSSALSLKVLLVLLRFSKPMNEVQLSEILNQSVEDIKDAVNYWTQLGVIKNGSAKNEISTGIQTSTILLDLVAEPVMVANKEESVVDFPETISTEVYKTEEKLSTGQKLVQIGKPRRLTMQEVNELAQDDKNIQALLRESQATLGRTLKNPESETIVSIYVRYEMNVDIILMILQYCVSKGKTGMAYIEKMATDWCERGIDSHEKAERELIRLLEQTELENELRATFGIYGRGITDRELEFYTVWTQEFKMSTQIIKLAYERNIDLKGKVSFSYINAILADWSKKNISTPDAALKEIKGGEGKYIKDKASAQDTGKASYDLNQFEEMIKNTSIWD